MIRTTLIISMLGLGSGLAAQTISFPSNASLTREVTRDLDSYAMPVGPWANGIIPTQIAEGQLSQQAWRILATGLTSLQLIRPLRDQLRNDGFEIVFECRDQDCGGFDFRFGTGVMPPPDMQINLGDFRYMAATKTTDDALEVISVIASKSARAGYVQVTRVGTAQSQIITADGPAVRSSDQTLTTTDLATELTTAGHIVLQGLTFETGSAQLSNRPFDLLQSLADFLISNPSIQIGLVGHTDSSGSLDGNIALSKRRAGSVLERLAVDYGVPRRQMDAQGMGYLAPIASNLTESGRVANRRVEAIITSTQ